MSGFYLRAPKVYFEHCGEEILVTLPETSRIISLSGSAIVLWDGLAKESSVTKLTKLLCAGYVINEVQAGKDVANFLKRCIREGIVVEK